MQTAPFMMGIDEQAIRICNTFDLRGAEQNV